MLEQEYVKLRLVSFRAKRSGDTKKAKSERAKADRIYAELSADQQKWANRELMAEVMAEGMNTINETYGW